MRIFLDTEFVETPGSIRLLSLGMVAEDGREVYIETPFAVEAMRFPERFDPWLQENVIPHLGLVPNALCLDDATVTKRVLDFVNVPLYGKPEFWGYYADYDWVAFCWIFGRMVDLPNGFPKFCRDVKQLAVDKGDPELPTHEDVEHHALEDARWTKRAYDFLQEYRAPARWSSAWPHRCPINASDPQIEETTEDPAFRGESGEPARWTCHTCGASGGRHRR